MTAPSAPRLAGYSVERLLGRGGSGEVWAARVTATGQRVALKWVSAPDGVAARREAAVLTALDHPHLIRIHEVVADPRGAALVLDLADGGSLAQLLAVRGRLSPGEVVTTLAPIASALAHAHANGVVHGDVTPANILFSAAGSPMLADLGVARLCDDRERLDGSRCTAQYADPSVVRGSVPTPVSDVFMLGAVAVHALSGAPVWPGTEDEALEAAAAADLRGLEAELEERLRDAHVPEAVAAVVLRATSVDPYRRGSATDFALDLRAAADPVPLDRSAGRRVPASASGPRHASSARDGSGVAPTRVVHPRSRPAPGRVAPPARGSRKLSWWAAAGVVAAIGVAGGVAWAVGGSGGTTARQPPAAASVLPGAGVPGVDERLATLPAVGTGSAAAVSAGATPLTLSADQAATVLQQLDVLREHAYDRRAPLLLTGVYVPGGLLDADTALLNRLVPAGCGLDGVRTTYDDVTVLSRASGQIVVSARSTLDPSVLVCDGRATGRAPGAGPDQVRITLVYRGHGYLIDSLVREAGH